FSPSGRKRNRCSRKAGRMASTVAEGFLKSANMRTRLLVPIVYAGVAGVTLWMVFAALAAFDDFQAPIEPRAPDFHDVSAFGDDDLARIDAWLQEQVDLAQYPSLSVAIVRDGGIVYQAAFGFENLEAARQATVETSYHVASV